LIWLASAAQSAAVGGPIGVDVGEVVGDARGDMALITGPQPGIVSAASASPACPERLRNSRRFTRSWWDVTVAGCSRKQRPHLAVPRPDIQWLWLSRDRARQPREHQDSRGVRVGDLVLDHQL
jgi:hypothetical protein